MDAVPFREGWNSLVLRVAVSYRCRLTHRWYGGAARRSESVSAQTVIGQDLQQGGRPLVDRQRVHDRDRAADPRGTAVGLLAVTDHQHVLGRHTDPLARDREQPRVRLDGT